MDLREQGRELRWQFREMLDRPGKLLRSWPFEAKTWTDEAIVFLLHFNLNQKEQVLILIASKKLKEESTRIRNALFVFPSLRMLLLSAMKLHNIQNRGFQPSHEHHQDFDSVEDGRWKGERACRNQLVRSIQGSLKLTSSSTFWEILMWNVLNIKPVADLYPQLVRLLSHLFFSRLKFYVTEIQKRGSGLCLRNLLTKIYQ